jgi:hypothetical protein
MTFIQPAGYDQIREEFQMRIRAKNQNQMIVSMYMSSRMIEESSGIIEQACGTFHVSGGLQFSSLEYDRHNELYVFALEHMSRNDTFFLLILMR